MEKATLKEFRTLFPYLKKYKYHYIVGIICLIIVDAAQMYIPQLIRQAVDMISAGTIEITRILGIALTMISLALVISAGRFLWRFFIHGSSRRIEAEIRGRLFNHLITLSYDFYQKNKIGDLMARATNDMNAVRMAIGMGFVAFIDGTVMAAAIITIMFIQDAGTAALAITPLPLITILILVFGRAVGKRFKRSQEAYSKMSEAVQETFSGIRVIKSFVKEPLFLKKFAETNDDYRKANMELVKIFGFFFPFISFLAGLTTLILLLVGGSRVIEGNMSAGELVALFSYLQMLIWPMLGAGFVVNMMQRGAASLQRINEIFNSVPAIASPEEATTRFPEADKNIPVLELRNLTFTYPDGTTALRDISLKIPKGTMLGILGRTGSGKTSLLKTLPRMIDPPQGSVYIHGVDVRDWDLQELRSRFGFTPQDSFLFSESIKDNIAFGVLEQDEHRLQDVVSISMIAKDLEDFNDGWNTVIGEKGLTLSGGQKQRVAMSRALIRKPEILVLDDSLSAVDADTEKRILDALLKDRDGKTTLIVSHRVSTLAHADTVIVLENGKLTEQGSPEELAASDGFFAQMAKLQRLEQPKMENNNG